jgi:hypothetical protein
VGKHARRASVFTDESGRRTRLAATAVRSTTVGVLGIVGAVVVGLLSGVPLPGVTPPVHLPSNEPVRAEPPATPSATPARSTDVTTPVAASGSPTNAPGAPVTPTPTAPTSSASTSAQPGNGNRQSSTSTPTTTNHGHPPATPPGRTKHP